MKIHVKSLSWSTVSSYLLCPDQVWYDKILHLPRHGTSSALVLGTCVHSAAESHFLSVKHNKPLSPDVLDRVITNKFKSYNPFDITYNDGQTPDTLNAQAKSLVHLLAEHSIPEQIIGTEVPFDIQFLDDLRVVGQIDLLCRDEHRRLVIYDLKTSAKAYSDDDVCKVAEQTLLYSQAYNEPVIRKAIVLIKTKTPKLEVLNLTESCPEANIQDVMDRFAAVKQSLEAGIHFKQKGWQCKSCSFKESCQSQAIEQTNSYSLAA